MTSDALIIEGLCMRIGEVEVLGGINTRLQSGCITAFIGPNGAGKTTLFHAITGELKPDGGRVIFQGEDITGREPWELARKGVGKVFQDVRVFPSLSPVENVMAALHRQTDRSLRRGLLRWNAGSAVARTRAIELLNEVGLVGAWEGPAGELSWGNQKLLAFARLMAGDFRFVLLDEPVAGVSSVLGNRLKVMIRKMAESGVTVALTEHDMAFVRDLADEAVVLKEGRVFDQGPAREVLERPANLELCLGL